jgi:RES domain-containing protein
MALRVYRVCRAVHTRLDGEGARQAGGRWNLPGRAVVYMAESIALAVLENLVHMSREDFPTGYVEVSATVPADILVLTETDVRTGGVLTKETEIGEAWLTSLASAVLKVRSTVVRSEHNYLLNPRHPNFACIQVEQIRPFVFDSRLFK